MSKVVCLSLLACLVFPSLVLPSTAAPVREAETQALIQRLVLDRAATISALQRAADERERRMLAELDAKDRRPRNRRFKQVVATARAMVSGKPQLEVQNTRSLRRWLAGAAVALALPLMSFFSDAHELLAPVCQIPGVHAACSRWGLGGVPTPEEEAAWASRKPGDCSVLREHLRRFPERRLQAPDGDSQGYEVAVLAEPWRLRLRL